MTLRFLLAFAPLISVAQQQSPPARTVSFVTTEGTWVSLDVSRDGREIVFELLGDVYVIPRAGGVARAVLTGRAFQSQPRYSRDGRHLAYVSDESGSDNVWIAGIDGSTPRQVTHLRRATVLSPEWSADGASTRSYARPTSW